MKKFPSFASISNVSYLEQLYETYQKNPEAVEASWRYFFEGVDFATFEKELLGVSDDRGSLKVFLLIDTYRRIGHQIARTNPLDSNVLVLEELNLKHFDLLESDLGKVFPTFGLMNKKEAPLSEIIDTLKKIYTGSIGFEYMFLQNPKIQNWIQKRIESNSFWEPKLEEKKLILEYLNKAELFESFLHTKYVGQTRFSLEGAETMIPMIAELIDHGSQLGVEEVTIGMAHRGRLNVLTNILNKPLTLILEEFEDDTTLSFAGNDDVRYHMGFTGVLKTRHDKEVTVSLAANPSHLESVDPVLIGQAYARQKGQYQKLFPIIIHGDASVAGQGVVYETLQLMNLKGYSVGGAIHLVVNNQIGYTTLPEDSRSTRYATDIAKGFSAPVLHVNAEDPEACFFAAKLAVEIRQEFHLDVFLDLVCYRKYGHNEGDEPSFTQPLHYKIIKAKQSIRQIYLEKLMHRDQLDQQLAQSYENSYKELLQKSLQKVQATKEIKAIENRLQQGDVFEKVETKVSKDLLQKVLDAFVKIPDGFHLHPKLKSWLENRKNILLGKIDWASSECLAFGSLRMQNFSLRLAGQDAQRGTFSQRHFYWIDSENAKVHNAIGFDVINSPLSEYAGLGFEYGLTWGDPNMAVFWEAQYGDFNNGAQIIIDQYIVSAEHKWNCPSSITMLLPHGYEGAGPEHSSARMERFLQLCANDNIQVVYPSTPAQYFHLLRRQVIKKIKKPLIVMTPKSLLRAPICTSELLEFENGSFQEILDDPNGKIGCKKLIFCSGKIYYDLIQERKNANVTIIRIEQLYPLNKKQLDQILSKYTGYLECVWVQEEPENMGAWTYIKAFLPNVKYIGRSPCATTATGSNRKHKQEQKALIEKALS